MKKLGNPEVFDNESECPQTSWGQKFRNTRLVLEKKMVNLNSTLMVATTDLMLLYLKLSGRSRCHV